MFHKKITFKILAFLVASDVLETLTQFLFKKSVLNMDNLSVTNVAGALVFLKIAFSSYCLWLALLTVIVVFIIWSGVLSKIDLSVAVPIASFSYILVPLVSIIFLQEKVTLLRWSGIFFILLGVIFVSLSSKERAKEL